MDIVLGCNGSKKNDWPIEKIRQWVEVELRTHKWVAEQLGCSNQHVSTICKANNIKAQRTGPRSGPNHTGWKGGVKEQKGYRYVYQPNHPNCIKSGYVAEHRLVMEQKLGRFLERDEVVHHIDGNIKNNHPNNLEVFQSNADHLRHELKGRCPNWTPQGYQRMKAAARRKTIRAMLKRGGYQQLQLPTRPTSQADNTYAGRAS
jgi:hypothetical protein